MKVDPARRLALVDVALGLGAATATVLITTNIEPTGGEREIDGAAVLLMLAASLSLAFRRRASRVTLAITTLSLLIYTAQEYAGGPVYLTLGIALYSVAATNERRDAIVPAGASALTMMAGGLVLNDSSAAVWHLAVFPSWAAAALFLGDARRNRRDYLLGLEERARWLEESREEEARRRVAEERLRIARDLHDVIAHSIATITLQSGVAAHVLGTQPEAAADALEAIKRTSRDALHELKATLDVLRADSPDAPRAPTPGLARVEALVESARQAGLPVTVRWEGELGPMPAAVDVAGYRIVQESITNVMRHAGPARAEITIATTPSSIEIEVVDDGRGASAEASGGHGIAGMRERAFLAGGTLAAGARPGGGYRVFARLPLDGADQVTA